MKNIFLSLTSFFCITLLIACECRGVDCADDSQTILLRFVRNGANAVFGPHAFINKDSVMYVDEYSILIYKPVFFLDTGVMYNYISENSPVIIKIDSIQTDTFAITTEVTDTEGCCIGYTTTSVLRNGQVICTGVCGDIIDVEI